MAEKVVCKDPEFVCDRVVRVDLGNKGQAVAGYQDGCSTHTRPAVFVPGPLGNVDDNIRDLRVALKDELERRGRGEKAIANAVQATTVMPNPLCNQPFRVEKFIVVEIPNVGKGAIGQEENNGCSSHTRPMLIEPLGNDLARKQANFELLQQALEQALTAAANRP